MRNFRRFSEYILEKLFPRVFLEEWIAVLCIILAGSVISVVIWFFLTVKQNSLP